MAKEKKIKERVGTLGGTAIGRDGSLRIDNKGRRQKRKRPKKKKKKKKKKGNAPFGICRSGK